jgi:hypothetical protein
MKKLLFRDHWPLGVEVRYENFLRDLFLKLPLNWRLHATVMQIGQLATHPRLANHEVPKITVGELIDTMTYIEQGPEAVYCDIWLAPRSQADYKERPSVVNYQRLARADLAITTDGWVIKDRYGRGHRVATAEEVAAAERQARREEMAWQS